MRVGLLFVVTVVVVMVLQAVVIDEGGVRVGLLFVCVCCYCSGGDGAAGSGNR